MNEGEVRNGRKGEREEEKYEGMGNEGTGGGTNGGRRNKGWEKKGVTRKAVSVGADVGTGLLA